MHDFIHRLWKFPNYIDQELMVLLFANSTKLRTKARNYSILVISPLSIAKIDSCLM